MLILGQRVVDKERTEEIALAHDEVVVGIKYGTREHGPTGKKEEGIVTGIKFIIAQM